jgi:acetyl-CoA synthetase
VISRIYMPLIQAGYFHAGLRAGGATHSVVFGGFSSAALIDRINDAYVVTADGGWRRSQG